MKPYNVNCINNDKTRCLCKKCREARQKEKRIIKECEELNEKIESGVQDLSRATEMTRRKKIHENKNIWG